MALPPAEPAPAPARARAEGPPAGRLAENIARFVEALRRAGVGVGSSQLHNALEAVRVAGFTRRDDFYWTLRATLITRAEHFDIFDQIFGMFWRTPDYLEKMMEIMLPVLQTMSPDEAPPDPAQRRAREAMAAPASAAPPEIEERPVLEFDARLSWSAAEVSRARDFEQMSAGELAQAARAIRQMVLPAEPLRTRRLKSGRAGPRLDLRASLRRSLRMGGELDRPVLRRPATRPPALVVLCDVSGSMATYSRMMMHFLHALSWSPNSGWGKVHAFTFGTRLTNVTRALAHKDTDRALAAVGREVEDWEGGTRIGAALGRFNRDWSRRVLGQGAVVMMITDGLERGELDELDHEAERLALSCRRLLWLNPLLRWSEFEAKAGGIRTLLPHVDSLHACHSLGSIAELTRALASEMALGRRWDGAGAPRSPGHGRAPDPARLTPPA